MGQIPQDGNFGQNVALFLKVKVKVKLNRFYCPGDAIVWKQLKRKNIRFGHTQTRKVKKMRKPSTLHKIESTIHVLVHLPTH